jgi:hypothetical protein
MNSLPMRWMGMIQEVGDEAENGTTPNTVRLSLMQCCE